MVRVTFPYRAKRLVEQSARLTFTKGKLVNKSQLIDALAARYEGNRKAASHALESVLETITRDDVLLNLELFDNDIKPGTLMAIDVVSEKPVYPGLRKLPSQDHGDGEGQDSPVPTAIDIGRRYLFFVKDMPKELRTRHPTVDLFVAKYIADAFGIKKGCTVSLTPVSGPPCGS